MRVLASKEKETQKKVKKPKRVTVSKSGSCKWRESNSELSEDECEQRCGNKCVKRSADLQQAIENAKCDHTKLNLIDTGHERKYLKWFTVSSANGCRRKYKVEIAESIKCIIVFCIMFSISHNLCTSYSRCNLPKPNYRSVF